ncbi:MAG: UDP-N-acetylmuramoyl-L-alanyl-D-glutamate--2,6-diaminopimelate ligase [Clostridiales bacterium]|jgi:UDP-N-acetylmuramoyl-L-alanyl-D-glutamate--2,6-diaminopimelate ligase|nr:UDP-N-acetylmuramoyl-L-alanyl-D-glutamate--2,6-diaminopimelate ligase [Clostridiales bacterium]MDN5283373.1 UDP-N-acetylmuramoyl-L-alanyl-D-glutamate--2,6-diaminopimelate ligase [Candidatus Ozemobacter sp.]
MKTLRSILPSNVLSTTGVLDIEISGVAFDSRQIHKGYLFCALNGHNIDGSAFIFDAIERGAAAIVTEASRKNIEVPVVKVDNARKALSQISKQFYDDPSAKIKLLGITGTKGKTTITYLTQSILRKAFEKAFRIGTVEYDMEFETIQANNTTPESQVVFSMLDQALKNGIKHGIMEVSSHALKTWRVEDISFSVAGFTNLSLEHTEFHPSMDDYFDTKKRLFTELAKADKPSVIGIDNDYGQKLAGELKKLGKQVFTVSVHNSEADFYSSNQKMTGLYSDFEICNQNEKHKCRINLAGEFNIFNALMAAAMCRMVNADWTAITEGISSLKNVPGRFESIKNEAGINVIVDYAHSPSALENVLKTVRPITRNKVFAVFGCGGNRSQEKRPVMGRIAYDNADVVVVTSDNPRKEPPDSIIEQIMGGIPQNVATEKTIIKEADRKLAILQALKMAKAGDTVVIAGKGHETGQYFADKTIPFDDREVARSFFKVEQDEK